MTSTWLNHICSRGLGLALAEAVLSSGDQLAAKARDTQILDNLNAPAGRPRNSLAP